jgi:hypothetical protein
MNPRNNPDYAEKFLVLSGWRDMGPFCRDTPLLDWNARVAVT